LGSPPVGSPSWRMGARRRALALEPQSETERAGHLAPLFSVCCISACRYGRFPPCISNQRQRVVTPTES
jgi:hypothetical protein